MLRRNAIQKLSRTRQTQLRTKFLSNVFPSRLDTGRKRALSSKNTLGSNELAGICPLATQESCVEQDRQEACGPLKMRMKFTVDEEVSRDERLPKLRYPKNPSIEAQGASRIDHSQDRTCSSISMRAVQHSVFSLVFHSPHGTV